VSICRNNSVNSFFGLPPPLVEEDHFSQAFHQTLYVPSPTQTPTSLMANNPTLILNSLKPIKVIESFDENPSIFARKTDGERKNSGNIDLTSCTESLGFESSDEIITSFDDLGFFDKKNNNNFCRRKSTYSSNSSLICRFSRRREKRVPKSEFPPPLTTLDENGRRSFMLKSVRKDGRLEIAEVVIERPEILRATRENGRLRLNLIQTVSVDDDDDHEDEDEEEETERGLKIPTSASLRRCYDHQHVWGPHQHRFVTTI
ncbi:Protein FANTASTIC FOUR 3, partial [Bienertia sinuspersici]